MLSKKVSTILISLLTFTAVNSYADSQQEIVKEVAVSVMDVYVPSSLKGDQQGYVVITGLFPNTCYTFNRTEVNNVSAFEHEIRAIANVRSGICLRMLVPFNSELPLGYLKKGQHKLSFIADDGTSSEKVFELK